MCVCVCDVLTGFITVNNNGHSVTTCIFCKQYQ